MTSPSRTAEQPPFPTTLLLLALAVVSALASAIPATFVDPPGSDLHLHGRMAAGAAEALSLHGWTAFQDPWLPDPDWGYPLLHVYPHVSHHIAAVASVVTGIDPLFAMGLLMALATVAIPLTCFLGGRWLGLKPQNAAVAALAAATLHSLDVFGHNPLAYSFESAGLAPQAVGGALAALAIPALVAAAGPPAGSTLASWSRGRRMALAIVLLSLVLRSHLVAGWITPLVAGSVVVMMGREGLGRRLAWLAAAGLGAAVLSAGFLLPFITDLGAVHDSSIESSGRSYGFARVMHGLLGGGFLDAGLPGVWTLGLAFALVGLLRTKTPVARPLGVALGVLVLLMAGRATWGDWMGDLPLIGRFHDQRYLLGVHLVVPWLIGASAADGLLWLQRIAGRAAGAVRASTAAALAFAVFVGVSSGGDQLKTALAAQDELAAWRPQIDPVVAELEAEEKPRAVLSTFPDDLVASTTPMSWLQRKGLITLGRPLHHYSHGYEIAIWIAQHKDDVEWSKAAEALGVGALLHRDGDGYRLERVGDADPDVTVVRSDLLMTTDGATLDGLGLTWWQTGAWSVGQHPAVALDGRTVTGPFERTGELEQPNPQLLVGLAPADPGFIVAGGDPIRGVGSRDIRVRVNGTGNWLKVAMGWHPSLEAEVDGRPAEAVLLLPGHVGVRLPPGAHSVLLRWEVPAWRGWWAGLNVLLVLGLLGWATRRRAA